MLNGIQRNASHFLIAASLIAGLFLPHAAPAQGLNDSGQTLCYDGSTLVACTATNTGDAATYPRQDGRYGRDAAATVGALPKTGGGAVGFDFTAFDATGQPTTPSSGPTPHPCVRDNVTELIWEVKTDDDGLRDRDWTYTWYSTVTTTNGGNAGSNSVTNTCNSTLASCNIEAYAAAVNSAALCGFNDWRLPSFRELQTLVHYGAQSPAIDTTYFPNTVASNFWSASTYVPNPARAWYVSSNFGGVDDLLKTSGLRVRLVRGGQF